MNQVQQYLKDIGKRLKSMNPTWTLGTGMDLGNLQPFSRYICFTLLVRTFFKELQDDANRTREDLIRDTLQITVDFGLSCTYELAEKIFESLLWSTSKKFTFCFEDAYFDEESGKWEIQQYQYFKIDRENSDLPNGREVYQLSEESQEIVLKSKEILDELDISIQQMIAEMFIRKGNLKSALHALEVLRVHVRRLIAQEKEWKEEVRHNAKAVFFERKGYRNKQIDDIRAQFHEEINQYRKMEAAIRNVEKIEERYTTKQAMIDEIQKTSRLHNELANLVIENISIEINIKSRHYYKLWEVPKPNFKEIVWDHMQKTGLDDPKDMFTILTGIFSPKKPFLFPLEWMVLEQEETEIIHFDSEKEKHARIKVPISLDWDTILKLWEPYILRLMNVGKISIREILDEENDRLTNWILSREAFDFWLAFGSMETELFITEETLKHPGNSKLLFLKKMIERDDKFKLLYGCVLSAAPTTNEAFTIGNDVYVDAYELKITTEKS